MKFMLVLLPLLLQGGLVKDDFIVHSDSPNRCEKSGPKVAALPDGWVVVWTDFCNAGLGRTDPYSQLLAGNGTPTGVNFRVSSSASDQAEAARWALVDCEGNSLIVFTRGGTSYYRRRFSSIGEPQEDEQRLPFEYLGGFSSAMNAEGEYVYVWKKPLVGAGPIYIQGFNPDDTPNWDSTQVATPTYPFPSPDAAISTDGSSVVVWQDEVEGIVHLFARSSDPQGAPRGEAFQIDVGDGVSYSHDVGMDADGNFVITWVEEDGVYFRRFRSNGTPKAGVEQASDLPAGAEAANPRIAMVDAGSFAILWSDNRSGNHKVYLQCFNMSGGTVGLELAVSEEREADCLASSLAVKEEEWFAVYSMPTEILGRRGYMYGMVAGEEILVSDDENSVWEVTPQVLMRDDGSFTVLWGEDRVDTLLNYGQRFSADGSPQGTAFPVHRGWAHMNRASGEFSIVWYEKTNGVSYIQPYSWDGQPQGTPIEVPARADLAVNRSGKMVVGYVTEIDEKTRVMAQRFDNDGLPTGDAFYVDEDTLLGYSKQNVAMTMKDDDSFIITWADGRYDAGCDIYARRFDNYGNPTGSEFQVSDDTASGINGRTQVQPCIAIDESGNFCIAWGRDGRLPHFPTAYAYAQFYDAEGNKLGDNFNTGLLWKPPVTIGVAAAPQRGYVIFGSDYSNEDGDPEVCAVYYRPDGTQWTRKVQINQPDLFGYNHQITGVAYDNFVDCSDDRIIYVWLDNRRHKGWDVYAKITDWDVPAITEQPPVPQPSNWQVTMSVGPQIVLRYSHHPGGFHANVYDASGQKVGEIHNPESSGTILWGQGQQAGVYFIKQVSGTGGTQKVVLVR